MLRNQSSVILQNEVRIDRVNVLGLYQVERNESDALAGRIVVFGDSGCLDDISAGSNHAYCWKLLDSILTFAINGSLTHALSSAGTRLAEPIDDGTDLPLKRVPNTNFKKFSHVMDHGRESSFNLNLTADATRCFAPKTSKQISNTSLFREMMKEISPGVFFDEGPSHRGAIARNVNRRWLTKSGTEGFESSTVLHTAALLSLLLLVFLSVFFVVFVRRRRNRRTPLRNRPPAPVLRYL